jgi:hypothetical protein
MNEVAIVLIIGGILGLVYGSLQAYYLLGEKK